MDKLKGFVIGATGSGTGKTTVSLGIMAWLAAKGVKVAPFKVGPDFIDPGLHTKISGSVSHNLDSWMLSRGYNRQLFYSKARGKDIAVVEGVMGLFDGYDALSDTGSTAQMAKWLGLPVLLIVSAKGKARSAAAIVKGFESFDPDLRFAGVIFAQAGSERHYHYLRDAVEQSCKTPCLGYLPKNEKIVMPERHLGLVTADEMPIERETLSTLVSMVDDHLDMDRLIRGLIQMPVPEKGAAQPEIRTPPKARIAVARDKAFCFYYPDNLDILKSAGAEILMFSPLEDDTLPENIDGIYFGGGYPELNAGRLAEQTGLLEQVKAASRAGMPIYGECGGFMYLCRNIAGDDGEETGRMCGIFDFDVRMSKRLRSLGYREITLNADTLIGRKGDVIRGHEFHYSSIAGGGDDNAASIYKVTSRAGQEISLQGFQKKNTLGSYLHVHFGSNPNAARQFVACCARYRQARDGGAA
ncbi:MAG: cobyrinate a,c-diamide synthase [Desulfobacter sp.]|nr:MAG: cobyrinate a,c-diamide synthase [Desulfobacter sp.]